jgi:proline iminopeptidase
MKTLHKINDTQQWVLVKGQKAEAPLIIHVQAGPGFPMIPEAGTMEKLLGLEQNYLVAYWDQRGCGKSFNKNIAPETINLRQMADDLISCTRQLLELYSREKAILIGYSIGATVGLMAAVKNSVLFSELFLVGIDIDLPNANTYAQAFIEQTASERNNNKWIKLAGELQGVPMLETKVFQKRAQLLTDMGGINTKASYQQLLFATIKNMLFSKEYKLADIPKTIKGMEFCQNALLPEFDELDLFKRIEKVDVPVHFIQGKKDAVAPYQIAVDYFNYLQAPVKSFTSFEESAHMPQYEEPGKFAGVIEEKLAGMD